ncbi:hypothetical protein JCM30204_08700 [Dysgonomonas termitidis]|uniref:Uncharacterized protein n=2 Tax=Dysgonomonas termitidis TaxID=1516126 RepID=A0ABV9KQX9_9BACT
MEAILTAQLEAANVFNKQLLTQIETLSATIKSIEGTIASLQEALLQKDESLTKSANKIRGISKRKYSVNPVKCVKNIHLCM